MFNIWLTLWDGTIIEAELPECYKAVYNSQYKGLFPELYTGLLDERDAYIKERYGKWRFFEIKD